MKIGRQAYDKIGRQYKLRKEGINSGRLQEEPTVRETVRMISAGRQAVMKTGRQAGRQTGRSTIDRQTQSRPRVSHDPSTNVIRSVRAVADKDIVVLIVGLP